MFGVDVRQNFFGICQFCGFSCPGCVFWVLLILVLWFLFLVCSGCVTSILVLQVLGFLDGLC